MICVSTFSQCIKTGYWFYVCPSSRHSGWSVSAREIDGLHASAQRNVSEAIRRSSTAWRKVVKPSFPWGLSYYVPGRGEEGMGFVAAGCWETRAVVCWICGEQEHQWTDAEWIKKNQREFVLQDESVGFVSAHGDLRPRGSAHLLISINWTIRRESNCFTLRHRLLMSHTHFLMTLAVCCAVSVTYFCVKFDSRVRAAHTAGITISHTHTHALCHNLALHVALCSPEDIKC